MSFIDEELDRGHEVRFFSPIIHAAMKMDFNKTFCVLSKKMSRKSFQGLNRLNSYISVIRVLIDYLDENVFVVETGFEHVLVFVILFLLESNTRNIFSDFSARFSLQIIDLLTNEDSVEMLPV